MPSSLHMQTFWFMFCSMQQSFFVSPSWPIRLSRFLRGLNSIITDKIMETLERLFSLFMCWALSITFLTISWLVSGIAYGSTLSLFFSASWTFYFLWQSLQTCCWTPLYKPGRRLSSLMRLNKKTTWLCPSLPLEEILR